MVSCFSCFVFDRKHFRGGACELSSWRGCLGYNRPAARWKPKRFIVSVPLLGLIIHAVLNVAIRDAEQLVLFTIGLLQPPRWIRIGSRPTWHHNGSVAQRDGLIGPMPALPLNCLCIVRIFRTGSGLIVLAQSNRQLDESNSEIGPHPPKTLPQTFEDGGASAINIGFNVYSGNRTILHDLLER